MCLVSLLLFLWLIPSPLPAVTPQGFFVCSSPPGTELHGIARNCTEFGRPILGIFCVFLCFSCVFQACTETHGIARNGTELHGTPGARLGAPAGPSPAQPPRVASERIRNDFFGKSNGSIILFWKTMIFINLLERSMISLFFENNDFSLKYMFLFIFYLL